MSSPTRRREGWIEVEEIGSVTVVHFARCKKILDEPSIEPFRRPLMRLVDEYARRKVLLNFTEVEFWSSAALGVLITVHRKLLDAQGKLFLWNVAEPVLDVMKHCKIDRIINIVTDPRLGTQDGVIHEIFGSPYHPVAFSPAWRTDTAVALARTMYESREFSAMPILADAIQDAGCDNEDVLGHCRGPGPHVRDCWVLDLVLGKK